MPVSDGMKNRTNSAVSWNLLGALRTGPKPPASEVIHHNISRPTESMNGAATPSRILMVSMPRQTTSMLSPQKKKKQRSEEHTSELQSRQYLVCRLLLEKK